MTIAADMTTWLARGDALKCFPSRIAQARYANGWEYSEIHIVAPQLERIFTRVHRLPALNWLAVPGTAAFLDSLVDGPGGFAEDWTEADFQVALPDGQAVSLSWLSENDSWVALDAMLLQQFLFLPAGEKIRLSREWLAGIVDLRTRFPASVQDLVDGAARASLLAKSLRTSESLRVLLWDADPGPLEEAATAFRERVASLIEARRLVFERSESGPRFLSFAAVRACQYVFQLDQLLQSAQAPATANLISYLRCQNAPTN